MNWGEIYKRIAIALLQLHGKMSLVGKLFNYRDGTIR